MTKFIDVHSHLDLCKNIPKIVDNFKEGIILTCGVDLKTNKIVLELSNKYSNVNACLGGYPDDMLKLKENEIDEIITFIEKNKKSVVAIAEVGIDLKHNLKDTLDIQKKNLKKFIDLAKSLNVPAVIHSRNAELETIQFLEELNYKKIVMHCFSGSMKLVKRIINNGWSLSIPANVKYSEHFQKVVEIAKIGNLFCETDSPFLHPNRERNNESKNVVESYKKISEIKGLSLEEVKDKIYHNYEKLFVR